MKNLIIELKKEKISYFCLIILSNMKGILKKVNNQWLVYYQEEIMTGVKKNQELPLFPADANSLNEFGEDSLFYDEARIHFEIVDEFTHQKLYEKMPWGVGKFAKLLK